MFLQFFTACGSDLDRLHGKWEFGNKMGHLTYNFKADGNYFMEGGETGKFGQAKGIYEIKDDLLFMYEKYAKSRKRNRKETDWKSSGREYYFKIIFESDDKITLIRSNESGEVKLDKEGKVKEREKISLARILE